MKNLVEVKNIKKNYGKNEAVKGISFSIKEDEILGLLGPNGSGKTTTIGMLLGLLKPTSGEIFINGQKLEGNRIEILEQINFISPYIELPKKLTVRENLLVYGKLYSVEKIKNRIDYLTETLRLNEFINKKTGELSSGQKNRVSLAKAVINDPDIDAVCRMIFKPECNFNKKVFPFFSKKISPFNSQNTLVSRKVIKDYFLFPHIGRMDDIWASFYVTSKKYQVLIYDNSGLGR